MESKKEWLSQEEVEALDPLLSYEIDSYVGTRIINWEEQCSCQAEGDAMEYLLAEVSGGPTPTWRARRDGTLDVAFEGWTKSDLTIEWTRDDEEWDEEEDGEREEESSFALDNLWGNVALDFDDEERDCNNEVDDEDLEEKIKSLFEEDDLD